MARERFGKSERIGVPRLRRDLIQFGVCAQKHLRGELKPDFVDQLSGGASALILDALIEQRDGHVEPARGSVCPEFQIRPSPHGSARGFSAAARFHRSAPFHTARGGSSAEYSERRQIFFRFRTAGADPGALELLENRSGAFRSFRIVNRGDGPCRIREAVALSLPHTFPADTRIYGEGVNMLSQYRGTLEEIEATAYTDRDHYRLPVRGDILTLPPRSARVILVHG